MSAFLDLFAGIGGFALGAYWAGLRFDEHYYSEVDDYAIRVYQQRFPDAIGLGDITKIDGTKLPKGGWIIAGGFPCQDISVAGKGAGLAGARSGLWFEMLRLIGDLRPRYAIVENVGALLVRGIDTVLGTLAEIGYDAEWQIISAASVGAPHRRDRVYIVAYPNSPRWERSGQIQSARRIDYSEPIRGREALAYPDSTGLQAPGSEQQTTRTPRTRETMADSDEIMRNGSRGAWDGRVKSTDSSKALADSPNSGNVWRDGELGTTQREVREHRGSSENGSREWWKVEPDVCCVAHGLPASVGRYEGRTCLQAHERVNQLKCLGNSIVPQIAELIFAQSAFDEWRKEATR